MTPTTVQRWVEVKESHGKWMFPARAKTTMVGWMIKEEMNKESHVGQYSKRSINIRYNIR